MLMAAGDALRISFVFDTLDGGGAERVMVETAVRIAALGHAATLIVGDAKGAWRSLVPPSMRLVDLEAHGKLVFSLRLIHALRREGPDAVLVTGWRSIVPILMANALRIIRIPVVVRERNTFSPAMRASRYRLIGPVIRALYRYASRVVCVSEDARADFMRVLPLDPGKVVAIYNPFDMALRDKASEPPDHPFFRDRAMPVLLSVGRLSAQKDFLTLLRAFREARRRRPMRMIILGEGDQRGLLERFVAENGLGGDVAFPGFRADAPAFMRYCDLFVFSSTYEGMPNALVQALFLGCRVVSTDCPSGPREILDNGRYGTLVGIGDWRSMAEAILSALDKDPPQLDAQFAARFSPETATRSYLEVLTAAAEDKPRPADATVTGRS
jgi:glycosyltransferase involved in cell wall biosynthesis